MVAAFSVCCESLSVSVPLALLTCACSRSTAKAAACASRCPTALSRHCLPRSAARHRPSSRSSAACEATRRADRLAAWLAVTSASRRACM